MRNKGTKDKERKGKKTTHQSNGIGTAPNHAPRPVPTAPPQTVSTGLEKDHTSRHTSPFTPWMYIRPVVERRDICAEQRRVWVAWVVSGAPKRTRMMARTGVARVRVRVMERRAGYSFTIAVNDLASFFFHCSCVYFVVYVVQIEYITKRTSDKDIQLFSLQDHHHLLRSHL